MSLKNYYELAKPGIIYGNLLTAAAGFFLASKGVIHWWLFIAMALGLSLVIGGSCVFNNYIDQDIDKKMERTKKRALVTGEISGTSALVYGSVLLIAGLLILFLYTNAAATFIAFIGTISYLAFYTPLKRKTLYSTIVGSIAGATPPVVGYCAVINTFNLEALLLFLILVFWQMPHFYAIAIYRIKEYKASSIPLLPIKKGIAVAKIHILFYIAAFTAASAALTLFGFTGYTYLSITLLLGVIWFWSGVKGFCSKEDTAWARRMFLLSLIVLTVLSITMALNQVVR
jgi:protoheme IX farnesyltransferase